MRGWYACVAPKAGALSHLGFCAAEKECPLEED